MCYGPSCILLRHERGGSRGMRAALTGNDPSLCRHQRGWWRSGIIVWCVLSVCYVPARYSEPASRPPPRLAQQSAPAVPPPPALPLTATERVLELSLEQAIHLALQNNLDVERGRLDPPVAHAQVEQARAVFDPVAGLTASLAQTKTAPQTATLDFDASGAVIGKSILRPFSKDVAVT